MFTGVGTAPGRVADGAAIGRSRLCVAAGQLPWIHRICDRVAIFGGYAALVGITFTPEVFAAAIDYVGISNLANFMRTLPPVAPPFMANDWHLFVGDPEDPRQEVDTLACSPITRVDGIRTPLLVVQGANDSRTAPSNASLVNTLVRAARAVVDPAT